MNILFQGSPVPKNNFFIVDFEKVEVDIDDFGLEIKGGDLAVIADFFDSFIQTFVEDYLIGAVNN
jgi:hypothetical protein